MLDLEPQKVRETLRYILTTIGEIETEEHDGETFVNTGTRQFHVDALDAKVHLCFSEDQIKELHFTIFEQLGWLPPEFETLHHITIDALIELMTTADCFPTLKC